MVPSRIAGRAPYGYRVASAGDAPTLEPDPLTAPVVRRVFEEYVDGSGLQAIAERLTADGIPRPSAYDQVRNPHHHGAAWSKAAVRAIVTNGRYAVGLVPVGLYQQAQQVLAGRGRVAERAGHQGSRTSVAARYALRGRLRCALCQRLMQGSWNNGTVYYRCRFPREYARANGIAHPANVYLREDRLLAPLLDWICRSLPLRLYEWAHQQPLATQRRLVARCRTLRELVSCYGQDPARGAELFHAMGVQLTYHSGHRTVHIRSEVLVGARVHAELEL